MKDMGEIIILLLWLMWVRQCHKLPMTGSGNHTTYIFMVMTGGWLMALFCPHSENIMGI